MPVPLKRTGGVLEEGIYRFVIVKAEERSGPNSEYINIQTNPFIKGVRSPKIVWGKVMAGEASRWRMEQFLNAVGAPDSEDESETLDMGWFVGKTFWAKVGRRLYQSTWQNDFVQFYTEEQAEEALEKLAIEQGIEEEMAGARPKSSSKSKAKANPVPELAETESEDVPF